MLATLALVTAASLLPAAPPPAGGLAVSAGDVTDRRRNDSFFSGLEIELKLTGEPAAGVRGARATVEKAVDDTGRNLVKENAEKPDFAKSSGDEAPPLKVELKNPARRAAKVKELSGRVEVFLPGRDASAEAKVPKFAARMDQPIAAPALKAANAQVTVVSRRTYEAEKKKDAERRKKEAEGSGLGGAMVEAFSALFEGFMGAVEENDVLVKVDDPGKKVFDVEVVDSKGAKLDGGSSMTIGSFRILKFSEKVPADAGLKVYVLTPKSLVTTPFQLKNVALP
jgi:hypothetical protein